MNTKNWHQKLIVLKNGLLISISLGICEIYKISDRSISLIGDDRLFSKEVVQVFACPKQDEFAILFKSGHFQRYRVAIS